MSKGSMRKQERPVSAAGSGQVARIKLKVKSSAAVDPALRNRPCSLFERRGFKDVRALRS